MPAAARALRRWAAIAKLRPGEPVFRSINKGGTIDGQRLTDRSVSRIVKVRLRQLAIASGRSAVDANKLVAAFSSHSLRAGFATNAAEHDQPSYRLLHAMASKHDRWRESTCIGPAKLSAGMADSCLTRWCRN
jgi:integrase